MEMVVHFNRFALDFGRINARLYTALIFYPGLGMLADLQPKNMALRPIVEYPAPVLLTPGDAVVGFDSELESLVRDMFETMYDAGGVGLAAQQIGVPLRLFVMDCDGLKLVAANPEIIFTDGEQTGEEGCLSVGKVHAELRRSERAVLRAQDIQGETFEREASGLAARCFLHETDHCDGILFIRHLSPLRRDLVKKKFRKLKKQ